jgi:uncharacterized protein
MSATDLAAQPPKQSDRRPLLAFFALVYFTTWACFWVARSTGALKWPLLIIGASTPSVFAVILTAKREGRAAVRALLRRLLQWRVGFRWYVFALGYMAAIKLSVAVIYRLSAGSWPEFATYPEWYIVLATSIAAMILGGPLGEEIGWRGYALPRLQGRFGFAMGSMALGALWALWHWPVFFIPGLDQYGQAFIPYVLYVTALSVAFAWLYNNTNGSLLLVVLMHAAVNQTKDIVTSRAPAPGNPLALRATPLAWITIALLWLAAAYFILASRRAALKSARTP